MAGTADRPGEPGAPDPGDATAPLPRVAAPDPAEQRPADAQAPGDEPTTRVPSAEEGTTVLPRVEGAEPTTRLERSASAVPVREPSPPDHDDGGSTTVLPRARPEAAGSATGAGTRGTTAAGATAYGSPGYGTAPAYGGRDYGNRDYGTAPAYGGRDDGGRDDGDPDAGSPEQESTDYASTRYEPDPPGYRDRYARGSDWEVPAPTTPAGEPRYAPARVVRRPWTLVLAAVLAVVLAGAAAWEILLLRHPGWVSWIPSGSTGAAIARLVRPNGSSLGSFTATLAARTTDPRTAATGVLAVAALVWVLLAVVLAVGRGPGGSMTVFWCGFLLTGQTLAALVFATRMVADRRVGDLAAVLAAALVQGIGLAILAMLASGRRARAFSAQRSWERDEDGA